MFQKFILSTFFIFFLGLLVSGCSSQKLQNKKPTVAVTTFALYDILKHVAGDTVNVVKILPFGVEPHSYEPTPKIMASIEQSALVVYSGAGLEPWTDGFNFKSDVINMSKYVNLRELATTHKGNATTKDPHYWLDFSNMHKATAVITAALIKIAPKYKNLYIKNEQQYFSDLDTLNKEYTNALKNCKQNRIIVHHNAYGYMADKYGFEVASLTGLSPDAEPNAKIMTSLIQEVEKYKLKRVFFESFVSDKAMKAIADEAGVKIGFLEPLGNITADEADAGKSYKDLMEKNLQKLSKALECQ